ncbi:hypothetical protein BSPWISOXPB_5634 [uncultured Gammaproteobacteria bacterium]|nr:hypothetical protein BSPWISOXPB_5634 [uncultured Gammaproteobacteria bacterium]
MPENKNKTIRLAINKSADFGQIGYRFFTIVDGLDASKFTLKGRELTFKATAFKARNNTYHVNIKVRFKKTVFSRKETAEITLSVTVTKTNFNDEKLHITTASNFSTPENTDKTIELTLNKGNTPDYKRTLLFWMVQMPISLL